MISEAAAFWQKNALRNLTRQQWESLCDGCGKCCLHRLEDEETGVIHFTNVACRLFNPQTCQCTDYANRGQRVPECLVLTPENITHAPLPLSCAYRRVAMSEDLPAWHPLVSGDPLSTHVSGHSVLGRVVPESEAGDLSQHLLAIDGF